MHGNVWKWCLDDWRSTYYRNEITDGSAFIAVRNFPEQKSLRGGSFHWSPGRCASVSRYSEYPVIVREFYGFRVCH